MLKQLLPKQVEFFKYFNEVADHIVDASQDLRALIQNLEGGRKHIDSIAAHEKKCEEITHETMLMLHQTFITPIDREDIHSLICALDETVDFIHAAAQRIHLFEIRHTPVEVEQLVSLCVRMVDLVRSTVGRLDRLKKPEQILSACAELRRMENEGDDLMRSGIARLFREESDVKELLKKKELIEFLETATDRCRSVANIIEGIVLEYA